MPSHNISRQHGQPSVIEDTAQNRISAIQPQIAARFEGADILVVIPEVPVNTVHAIFHRYQLVRGQISYCFWLAKPGEIKRCADQLAAITGQNLNAMAFMDAFPKYVYPDQLGQ